MCDGGNLDAELALAYGNHSSVNAHRDEITDKISSDIIGRALVFDVNSSVRVWVYMSLR